jgi:polyhydroxyalkanoate synthesis regulator phasin
MGRKKNVIAPNDERAVVAMDKQQKAIEKATELYGDGEPFDVERILDCMEFRSEQVGKNMNAFGRYCLWLKEAVGWGGFVKALESRQLDVRASYHAMLQVEKFGDNFATVANLGSRKARAITYFTKEEIDQYVKGGDLRGIPHDDVAKKTAKELEEEVRHLRRKVDDQEAKHKRTVKEMSEELEALRLRDSYQEPPTKEQLAAVQLEPLRKKLFGHLLEAQFHLDEAVNVAAAAQKVEGATFPQLQEWAKAHYEQLAPIGDLFEELDQALNNCGPDKKE